MRLRLLFVLLFFALTPAHGQDSDAIIEIVPEEAPGMDAYPPAPDFPIPPAPPLDVPDASPTPAPTPTGPPPVSIEIDLTEQKAYLLRNGRAVGSTPISSGRYTHLTPTGNFQVTQKDLNHKSTLYGKIVDGSGRTVIASADTFMAVPRGCRFVSAPMKHFIRFNGAVGMHAGQLPGYPASHGCVRLPAAKAKMFYEAAQLGAPVHVFGKTPARKPSSRVVTTNAPTTRRVAATVPSPTPRRGFFGRLFGRP
jgi:lipoprotein-anchoring transpeptidase ErfK/SrfK